jgi:cytochrome c oxidase subunit 2
MIYSRLILNNSSIVLPLFSVIKILVLSFDVIHSIGYYSLGIKIDSIPARINTAQSIRPLFKGQYRGFCFELCGQGHASMISTLQLE